MNTFTRHMGRNTRDTQKTVHKYTKTKYTKKIKQKNNQSILTSYESKDTTNSHITSLRPSTSLIN